MRKQWIVFARVAADRTKEEIAGQIVSAGTVKLAQEMIIQMGKDWSPELIQ